MVDEQITNLGHILRRFARKVCRENGKALDLRFSLKYFEKEAERMLRAFKEG